MTARIPDNLDFASYQAVLSRVLPEGSSCSVRQADGTTCWQAREFPEQIVADTLKFWNSDGGGGAAELPLEIRRMGFDQGNCFSLPLLTENSELAGYFLALVPGQCDSTDIAEVLNVIVGSLVRDMQLNSELDAMASELAERYEELNLVYHTEDQVNYFAEGQEALQQLVVNCCEYLNVGMAALLMKGKGIVIHHRSDGIEVRTAELLIEKMESGVYESVVQDRKALIVNDPSDPGAPGVWSGLDYRLLAMPVMDSKSGGNGVLAIVNHYLKPKFSNSDRNLLQVMARKAGKIVQVSYDPLTGLVTREGFEFFVQKQLRNTQTEGGTHCLLHFDIDQLHVINDTVSYEAGDAIVKSIAEQMRRMVRESDIFARLGGDELGILLRHCPTDRATDVADKLREAVADLVVPWEDRLLNVTVSVGVSPVDGESESTAAALAAAELACKAAKEMGKNRVHCYQQNDTALLMRHREMELVSLIQEAIKTDQFELYAQAIEPVQPISIGRHLEVLLRMRGTTGDVLPPDKFVPAAERYHLMPEIDRWVVAKTTDFLNLHWRELESQLEFISINLSGQSLGDRCFREFVVEALSATRLPLNRICLEITETAAVADLETAREFMTEMKEMGCRFALDDFGSGLSSFGYLRSLPVDYLKIDGCLVKEIAVDEVAASMVAAVQQVARVMKLETVAEFVESAAIMEKLSELGITFAQGDAVEIPKPLSEHFVLTVEGQEAAAR